MSSDSDKTLEEIQRRLESLDKLQQQSKPLFDKRHTPAAVRSHVTHVVIWAYVLFLGCTGLAIIFGGSGLTPDKTHDLIEISKTLFLPVVTFVVGHYFGSKTD